MQHPAVSQPDLLCLWLVKIFCLLSSEKNVDTIYCIFTKRKSLKKKKFNLKVGRCSVFNDRSWQSAEKVRWTLKRELHFFFIFKETIIWDPDKSVELMFYLLWEMSLVPLLFKLTSSWLEPWRASHRGEFPFKKSRFAALIGCLSDCVQSAGPSSTTILMFV